MEREAIDTVVVGAGQAGLAMSWHLQRVGAPHVLLERGRIGERWKSERWDALAFQFPNRFLTLPGFSYAGGQPDGFASAPEVAAFIDAYAARIEAPVRAGVEVRRLGPGFTLDTSEGEITARNVVVATGPYQAPRPLPIELPRGPLALLARDYRRPDALPEGGVLVVGAGASGCQIAEDLARAGRQVWLSVGSHRRAPRRYRGRDFTDWEFAVGEWDRRTADREPDDRAPVLTGVDGGRDMDIRGLAGLGVVLTGRLAGVSGDALRFHDDLAASLAAGDRLYDRYLARIDALIAREGLDAPPPDPAPPRPLKDGGPGVIDLSEIGTVIWCTGYRLDLGWIDLVLKSDGTPFHSEGVGSIQGLYFLGLPWLSRRKSTLLSAVGVGEDAARLADHIAAHAQAGRRVASSGS